MLFNLGMPADAAAAHDSDIAGSQSENQLSVPSRHSSPRPFSIGALPSWGLGGLSNKDRVTETDRPRYEQRRSVQISAIEHSFSSDEEKYVNAGSPSSRSQIVRRESSKQASRPKTTYQLAHPATNARHKRLKLRPKLLLQVQRVSPTSRPIPVLDVVPSTLFKPRLARKVPTILRGKRGLGPNDLIITTSDLYESPRGDSADRNLSSDEENGDQREVVATICQLLKDDALSKGKAEICLTCGPVWEATPLSNGSYEFAATTETGVMILRWVRRGPKKRRLSAPPGTLQPEDCRRFTFSVIDPKTRRHPVIASMTRNHLEVYDKYSMPTTAPSSPPSAMSVISDGSEMEAPLDQQVIETDENLRMLITVTGIWVAFREGWSPSFRYSDSAVNSKAARSPSMSKSNSTTAAGCGGDRLPRGQDGDPDGEVQADPDRRLATWSPSPSQHPTERSIQYGSLSKRSHSTGAAFIEKSKKRNSAASSRPAGRHSVLPTSRQSYDGPWEVKSASQNSGCCLSWTQQRKGDKEDAKLDSPSTKTPGQAQGGDRDKPEDRPTARNGPAESPHPTKGKRRHRLSNIFDFLVRKNGHHHR